MHIIRPSWLTHSGEQKDFEVYSCHVSPDGTRLATAAGDGHVRIWAVDTIVHAAEPEYAGKPTALAHMSYHSGTIHTVRFSPNGKWLASGADDKIICIYHLDENQAAHMATFGSNEPPPVENWKIAKRLIGHDNDVQDLAWSYDSSILVSVGLDSKIVVWSGHTFEKLKTIVAHQSHVKGITFDPANKFFATASDDRTIKIFKFTSPPPNATTHDMHNNFTLETTITSPFKSSPLTTYFRRCSWAPDGNHIAAANSVNGPVSSVAIVNRGSWDSDITLIGHEGPVEVASFSPRLFSSKPHDTQSTDANGFSTQPLVTVIACAGQDKALTVWNTSNSRPLVICQDLASKSISDLAWTPDGSTLFCTSLDGSIVACVFETGDLGFVSRLEENDKALQKFGANRRGAGVIEDVAGLRLEERSKAGELKGAEGRMGALMGDAGPTTNGNGTESATPAKAASPAPVTNGTNGTNGTPKPAAENPPTPAEPDPNAAKVQALKQRVTITKDGRKRVAPMLVSSSGTGQSSLPQSQLMASTLNSTANEAPQQILDLSKPYDGLPRGGLQSMLLGNKRKSVVVEAEDEESSSKRQATGNGVITIVTGTADGSVEPAENSGPAYGVVPTPEFIRPAVISPAMSISQIRLAVPKIRAHVVRSLDRGAIVDSADGPGKSDDVIFEAVNPSQYRDPAKITATKRGATLWQDFLPRSVILVTGSKNFWSAACEDGSIYVWTPAGRRLLNALIVDSQPVIIECRGWHLLCITATGMCHVWNIKSLSSPHPPVSLGPVLDIATHSLSGHPTIGPGVTSAHLNSNGNIVVTLNNGDGFVYSHDMYTWQRVSEAWWAVGSQYWNSNDSSVSSLQTTAVGETVQKDGELTPSQVSAGIIPHLERHTTNEVLLRGRAFPLQRLFKSLLTREGFERFESDVSIAHLENRVAAALQLGSKDEFRLYLFMYAKRLGAESMKGKVEELLRGLLGGILKDREDDISKIEGKGWQSDGDDICGWDRQELLRGVILILGKFRELQRTTVQYARVLDMVNDDDDVDSRKRPQCVVGNIYLTSIREPDNGITTVKITTMCVPERPAKSSSWLVISPAKSSSSASTGALSAACNKRRDSSEWSETSKEHGDDPFEDFWMTTPKSARWRVCGYKMCLGKGEFLRRIRVPRRKTCLIIVVLMATAGLVLSLFTYRGALDHVQDTQAISVYQLLRPALQSRTKPTTDAVTWLTMNSDLGHRSNDRPSAHDISSVKRPKAAIISLARNSELPGMIQSMTQLESRFNWKYNYPWIFFNDEPFSREFKEVTGNLTQSEVFYELIPLEHWSIPDWVDESRFNSSLNYLGTIGVGKGWMVSYHHMCRWNSGFFYKHPRLSDYDWYWRVEPDVNFFCDMTYDPFVFMSVNQLLYGFNMLILDDARSFPSLWTRTRAFIAANPSLIHPEADMSFILDETGAYNNCQFFSNFEIGSLNFWRSHEVQAYFEWLDKSGGFYYERWGDAPVHTLALAMFTPREQLWFFRDIGYQHSINVHCPPGREGSCSCEKTCIDGNFYKLVPSESRQRKPTDTCLRTWLGGDWLTKRAGWNRENEIQWGADGYQGYVRWE